MYISTEFNILASLSLPLVSTGSVAHSRTIQGEQRNSSGAPDGQYTATETPVAKNTQHRPYS